MWQQIWGQMVILIQASSTDSFWIYSEKLWRMVHFSATVIMKKGLLFWNTGYYHTYLLIVKCSLVRELLAMLMVVFQSVNLSSCDITRSLSHCFCWLCFLSLGVSSVTGQLSEMELCGFRNLTLNLTLTLIPTLAPTLTLILCLYISDKWPCGQVNCPRQFQHYPFPGSSDRCIFDAAQ